MPTRFYTEPRVNVIAQTQVVWDHPEAEDIWSIAAETMPDDPQYQFGHDNVLWTDDAVSDLEILPVFAGRACYQSFGEAAGRRTVEEYLGHILEVKHLSVIEHSSVSFYLQQVSRSFTHELVRHRIASYSQLSQRYVAPEDLGFVVPPLLRELATSYQDYWKSARESDAEEYRYWLELLNTEKDDLAKKKIREAARSVLPNATETKIVATLNLRGILEMLVKRDNPQADAEMQQVAGLIHDKMRVLAPHVFK